MCDPQKLSNPQISHLNIDTLNNCTKALSNRNNYEEQIRGDDSCTKMH